MNRAWWIGLVLLLVMCTGQCRRGRSARRELSRAGRADPRQDRVSAVTTRKKAESGLDMSTFSLLRKGGKTSGREIVVPGDPDASVLIEAIGPDAVPRMPSEAAAAFRMRASRRSRAGSSKGRNSMVPRSPRRY